MIKFTILSSLFVLLHSFLDHQRVKLAIDSGNEYYHKDKLKILFRPDQFFTGGVSNIIPFNIDLNQNLNQSNFLIPLKYLDRKVFQTDRTLDSGGKDYHFSYEIPLRLPGTYNLIFCFIETEFTRESERRFDILIQNHYFRQRFDIFKEAGGQMVALYENFEFTYRNDMILVKDKPTIDMKDNKLMLNVYLRGKLAKLDALILYHGNLTNILTDLNSELFFNHQIDKIYTDQVEFAQEVQQKAINYATKKQSSTLEIDQLMRQYLSPFQTLILNYLEDKRQANMTTHTKQIQADLCNSHESKTKSFKDFCLNKLLEPLRILMYTSFVFMMENKTIIMVLMMNFLMLLYCFGSKEYSRVRIKPPMNSFQKHAAEDSGQINCQTTPYADPLTPDKKKKFKWRKKQTQK